MHKHKAFTLVEMLIVVVIIGVLMTALVVKVKNSEGRARDVVRKKDLQTIYSANEVYYLDNGAYAPVTNHYFDVKLGQGRTCSYQPGTTCAVTSDMVLDGYSRIPGLEKYITPVPVDPVNNSIIPIGAPWNVFGPLWPGNLVYYYGNPRANGKGYDLRAQLENAEDKDTCGVKDPASCYNYSKNIFYYPANFKQ